MPWFDGTGPRGMGSMTGRGLGPCGYGFRRGRGNWFGRGLGYSPGYGRKWTATDEKAALDEEEEMLKEELAQIQEEKKNLKDQK